MRTRRFRGWILFSLSVFALSLGACLKSSGERPKIKNLILMIGDGMGPQQISLLEAFARHSKLGVVKEEDFVFKTIANEGALGVSYTAPQGSLVVDSASSASQLATGFESRSEMIGLDAAGDSRATILEKARDRGMMTGLISDTRITHATPSAFATHVPNRWFETQIAAAYLDSETDVILSSGIDAFVSTKSTGFPKADAMELKPRRKDGRNLLSEFQRAGYRLAFDREDMNSAGPGKLLGLFGHKNMPDGIWYSQNNSDPKRTIPNLKEMTQVALDRLSKSEKGFFLMVEGGQIDWGGHRNDAGQMLHEMIQFNDTVSLVREWVKDREDTLMVITADHETGSFGFSYHVHDRPQAEELKGDAFDGVTFKPGFNYGDPALLDKIYQQKISFHRLQAMFFSLPKPKQTAEKLAALVDENTEFEITLEQAKRILKTAPNRYYDPNHGALKRKRFPEINEFTAYYTNFQDSWDALLARELSTQMNVVWGTGGHTATPVMVWALGAEAAIAPYRGYMDHSELGRKLQRSLGF
jgi:alkaline phosphatase